MPRWDFHLACGISVAVLFSFCAIFPSLMNPSSPDWGRLGRVSLPLAVGFASLLIGSILPDIDGRGRIRWIVGPVIGSFALSLAAGRVFMDSGAHRALSYLSDGGALLFLGATAAGYGSILIPMRHRGIMHRAPAALAFSILCATTFALMLDADPAGCALVGAMAFSGYGWHLALDGSC